LKNQNHITIGPLQDEMVIGMDVKKMHNKKKIQKFFFFPQVLPVLVRRTALSACRSLREDKKKP
jgi:hypothetical protein